MKLARKGFVDCFSCEEETPLVFMAKLFNRISKKWADPFPVAYPEIRLILKKP